jgi:hypothetical protein
MTVAELETKQSDSNTEPFSRCKITSESYHEKEHKYQGCSDTDL